MGGEPREAPERLSVFELAGSQHTRIDLTTASVERPGVLRTEGVYDLAGDALTYCVAAPGRPRPRSFATAKGDGNTLVTLRRVGPPKQGGKLEYGYGQGGD